jgi:hypothetical protein
VSLALRQRLWFQNDGAPAHYGEDVRQWMNVTYPGRYIIRGRPIEWPPRLPDLTPMFLWGHLKDHVYVNPSRTIEDLVARPSSCDKVDANMLRRVRQNAVRGTAVWFEVYGGRFEHLL